MATDRKDAKLARGDPRDYRDVVLVAPVTVPYVRYSIRNSHWFVARALSRLLKSDWPRTLEELEALKRGAQPK